MQYYTTKEVAEILGLCVQYVQRLARTGKLESYKSGKTRRYTEEQIKKYVEGESNDE